jgi:hypothetical protein
MNSFTQEEPGFLSNANHRRVFGNFEIDDKDLQDMPSIYYEERVPIDARGNEGRNAYIISERRGVISSDIGKSDIDHRESYDRYMERVQKMNDKKRLGNLVADDTKTYNRKLNGIINKANAISGRQTSTPTTSKANEVSVDDIEHEEHEKNILTEKTAIAIEIFKKSFKDDLFKGEVQKYIFGVINVYIAKHSLRERDTHKILLISEKSRVPIVGSYISLYAKEYANQNVYSDTGSIERDIEKVYGSKMVISDMTCHTKSETLKMILNILTIANIKQGENGRRSSVMDLYKSMPIIVITRNTALIELAKKSRQFSVLTIDIEKVRNTLFSKSLIEYSDKLEEIINSNEIPADM